MTGRPGRRTMEMTASGGSSASCLARLAPLAFPCFVLWLMGVEIPLFCTLVNRGGNRRVFRLQGRARIISIVRWNLRLVIFGVDERQKCHQSLGPVLVIVSGNSLVFSRKLITSTGFCRLSDPNRSDFEVTNR